VEVEHAVRGQKGSRSAIEDAVGVSGDHRLEATIVAVGPYVKPLESQPALIDTAPAIVAALDAPTAVTPKGRILHEIVGSDKALTAREATPSVQIPGMGESAVSDNEADEMEEHLRGLGYIE
jgi:hypothetical protein